MRLEGFNDTKNNSCLTLHLPVTYNQAELRMKEKVSRIQTSQDVGVQGFSGGEGSIKMRREHCGHAGDGARDRVCERWLNTRPVSFDFILWQTFRAELPLRQACPRSPSNPESSHSSRRPLAELGTEVGLEALLF